MVIDTFSFTFVFNYYCFFKVLRMIYYFLVTQKYINLPLNIVFAVSTYVTMPIKYISWRSTTHAHQIVEYIVWLYTTSPFNSVFPISTYISKIWIPTHNTETPYNSGPFFQNKGSYICIYIDNVGDFYHTSYLRGLGNKYILELYHQYILAEDIIVELYEDLL